MGKRFRLENKMNLKKEQIQFESECKYIIGKTIIKVEYAEIAYDKLNDGKNIKPYYLTHYKNVHTVDFAVFFTQKQAIL